MNSFDQNYIPIMNSEAGLCLTAANWQELNITTLSLHLHTLLLKPGYALLKTVNLRDYVAYSGDIILNGTACVAKKGMIALKSPYDGSVIQLDYEQLIALIHHIKPKAVLLPPGITYEFPDIWNHWNPEIVPFISENDVLNESVKPVHGIYLQTFLNEHIKKWPNHPLYVTEVQDLKCLSLLKKESSVYVESDTPALLGMQGTVIHGDGILQLSSIDYAEQFCRIDNTCNCPVCEQNLTRAYLHHLYLHTPLLCQRFLIQHNVYYTRNYLRN